MVPTPHQKLLIQVCSKRTDKEEVLTLTLIQELSLAMSCCPPVRSMTVTLILEMKVMLESPRPTSTWSLWTWCGPSVEDIPGIRP